MINPEGTTSIGESVLKNSRLQTTVERWRPRGVFRNSRPSICLMVEEWDCSEGSRRGNKSSREPSVVERCLANEKTHPVPFLHGNGW